jgi:hypothetical protein
MFMNTLAFRLTDSRVKEKPLGAVRPYLRDHGDGGGDQPDIATGDRRGGQPGRDRPTFSANAKQHKSVTPDIVAIRGIGVGRMVHTIAPDVPEAAPMEVRKRPTNALQCVLGVPGNRRPPAGARYRTPILAMRRITDGGRPLGEMRLPVRPSQ